MNRTFKLLRFNDATGISGTGFVACGIVNTDGSTKVVWTVPAKLCDGSTRFIKTYTMFESWTDVVLLHGHNGKTALMWQDTGELVFDTVLCKKII